MWKEENPEECQRVFKETFTKMMREQFIAYCDEAGIPEKFRAEHNLDERPIIALLPGSRKQEIQKMLDLIGPKVKHQNLMVKIFLKFYLKIEQHPMICWKLSKDW